MASLIPGRVCFSIVLLSFAGLVSAEQEYTYIKASLGYPWLMFFVFLALIAIPFVLIVALSWHQYRKNGGSPSVTGEP